MTKLVQEESVVTQWFSNHHFPLAKLREMTVHILKKPLELIKAASTRFGTHTLVGERLLRQSGCSLPCRPQLSTKTTRQRNTRTLAIQSRMAARDGALTATKVRRARSSSRTTTGSGHASRST